MIHTVGPVWHGGSHREPELLASCYRNSLALAEAEGLASIAFPAISCGVYGYPLREAAQVAMAELRRPRPAGSRLREVLLVAFDARMAQLYQEALAG
ncbi:O-acetyl-ADP-ribose deacetylase [compost metagenome]